MPNDEKSAVSKFLEGAEDTTMFPKVDDVLTPPKETGEKIEEIKPEEKEEKEERLPFHKDPKVQKYLERMERKIEENLRSKYEREEAPQSAVSEFKEVVDSFTSIIGNDTPEKRKALESLEKALGTLDTKAARIAEAKIQEIAEREQAEEAEAEEELDNAMSSIEETYDVDFSTERGRKLQSDFAYFIEKIAPKDRNGEIIDYPDMHSAWETFSEMRKASSTPSRAKEIASRSMARSSENAPVAQKRVDWNAVNEYMDTLGK